MKKRQFDLPGLGQMENEMQKGAGKWAPGGTEIFYYGYGEGLC